MLTYLQILEIGYQEGSSFLIKTYVLCFIYIYVEAIVTCFKLCNIDLTWAGAFARSARPSA